MITVHNRNELDNFVINNNDKIILLYFGAVWCGPCKKLKNILKDEEFMKQYEKLSVVYIDIDNDNLEEIVELYNISSIPVVCLSLLIDNQVKTIDTVIGFNWNKVVDIYERGLEILNNQKINDNTNKNESDNLVND